MEEARGVAGASPGFQPSLAPYRARRPRQGNCRVRPTRRHLVAADVDDAQPLVAGICDRLCRHAGAQPVTAFRVQQTRLGLLASDG
jgi:hypothetical protein